MKDCSDKSVFSKNVLGWSPEPIQHKNNQVDSKNNNQAKSNMIKERFIKTHSFWESNSDPSPITADKGQLSLSEKLPVSPISSFLH